MYSKLSLQLIPLSQGNLFLMIGSLEVMHKLTFTIPSVIQIRSIRSMKSFRLKFNRKTSIECREYIPETSLVIV